MDEYYEGDVRRAREAVREWRKSPGAARMNEILTDEHHVHRAKKALFWTVFRACFAAMCAWSAMTSLTKIVARWLS